MREALCRNSTETVNAEAMWFKKCGTKMFEGLAEAGADRYVWMDRELAASVTQHFLKDLQEDYLMVL